MQFNIAQSNSISLFSDIKKGFKINITFFIISTKKHLNDDANALKERVDQIRTSKKERYWVTNKSVEGMLRQYTFQG